MYAARPARPAYAGSFVGKNLRRLPLHQIWRFILVVAVAVVLESMQLLPNVRRYAIVLAMPIALPPSQRRRTGRLPSQETVLGRIIGVSGTLTSSLRSRGRCG